MQVLPFYVEYYLALNACHTGSCDGMTYEEIEQKYPEEFERRKTDKLAYRYPRGESYLDVIARLEPMIIEMERHRSVPICAVDIIKCINATCQGAPPDYKSSGTRSIYRIILF